MKGVKIVGKRESYSDSDVESLMNFEEVLSRYASSRRNYRYRKYLWLLAGLLIMASGIVYWYIPLMKPTPVTEVIGELPGGIKADSISKAAEATEPPAVGQQSQNSTGVAPDKEERVPESEILYKKAVPVMGYEHLYEYFNRELKYPEEILADSIRGTTVVAFTINPDGQPVDISIENSLGPAFDTEAVRLIQNMPAWKPATVNGKPVRAKISLPLTFEIKMP